MLSIPQCVPATSGIYKIICTPTGKVYIGSSSRLDSRFRVHRKELRSRYHINRHLQSAWIKYGEDAFVFEVIELVLVSFLLEREQYWLDKYRSYDRKKGFNLSPTAGSVTGIKRTPDQRAKMSLDRKGRRASEEARANMSRARKGKKKSPEMRERLSVARRGMQWSDDVRQKLTAIYRQKSKLTESDIRLIRQQVSAGDIHKCDIAKHFGVSTSLITQIAARKVWKDID